MAAPLSDNLRNNSNKLLDDKEGPYLSKQAACLAIPIDYRPQGQTVKIWENGKLVEYWWPSALGDNDLVKKVPESTVVEAPPAPAGVSWIITPSLVRDGNNIDILDPAGVANWGGAIGEVTYPIGDNFFSNITLPTGDLKRIDYFVGKSDGTIIRKEGLEDVNPLAPGIDSDELYITLVLWNAVGGASTNLEAIELDLDLLKIYKAENSITANLWSWIGLASTNATISVKGWLDFLSNKAKLAEENIADLWVEVNGAWTQIGNHTTEIGSLNNNKANNQQTANLWSWIGLASSTATITVKGWLDFLSNKAKLAEENIADLWVEVNGAWTQIGNHTTEIGSLNNNKANNQQTANLWSWIGLASSTATITVKGWLDFLTNRVKLNEENKLDKTAVVQALSLDTDRVPSVKLLNDTFAPFSNQVAIAGLVLHDRLKNNAGTEAVFQGSHPGTFCHNGKILVHTSSSIHVFDELTLNRVANFNHSHGSVSTGFFVLIEGTNNVLFAAGNRISEISTVNNTLVRTVSHNGVMSSIAGAAQISPAEIFVTDAGNNLVYRVDIATLAIVSSVAMIGSSTNGVGGAVSANKTYYSYFNSISAAAYVIHIPTMTTITIPSRGRGGMVWYNDNTLFSNGGNGYQKDIINPDLSVTSDLVSGSPFAVQYGIPVRLTTSLIFLLSNSHKALVFNMATERYILNQEIVTGASHGYATSNSYLPNLNMILMASVSNINPVVYKPINFTIS